MKGKYRNLLPEIVDLLGSSAVDHLDPYAGVRQQATRFAYSEAMLELGETHPNVVVLDADVSKSIGTDRFAARFPERSFNFGIAEQNMMAAAAGMAATGLVPFATTYAVFASLRALDQIRNSIHYPNLNVKIAASHSGITPGPDGVTHQGQEDISLLRAIANSTVIAPADSPTTKQAVRAAADWPGPVYLSFTRDPVPFLFPADFPFEIGKIETIREGSDLTIIAMRDLVAQALVAAARLERCGVDAQVLYCHTIKPLDEAAVLAAAGRTGAVVTAENNVIFGGLGSAVAETLVENLPVPMKRIGVRDQFTESGPYLEVIRKYGLTYEFIEEAARQVLARKG